MTRFDESIDELEQARKLDPLSLPIATDSARTYQLSRHYDRAGELLRKALDMDPNFIRAHIGLALNHMQMARYEEAIAEEKKAFSLTGGPVRDDGTKRIDDTLAVIYAAAGRKSDAEKILAEMDEQQKQGQYIYFHSGDCLLRTRR